MDVTGREKNLVNILKAEESRVSEWVDAILKSGNKKKNIGFLFRRLAHFSHLKAMHAYFIEQDEVSCKQNFYLNTRLNIASIGSGWGSAFQTGEDILCALLSDCENIISLASRVETPEMMAGRKASNGAGLHVYMLQLAIRSDDEGLRAMIERVARAGTKYERSEYSAGRDFFSLLLENDKNGLEELIQMKHSRIRSANPVDEDFMSYLGTVETKLCWHKGISVQIDNPMVPMELMPVRPLENYDDVYEFLKPGWVSSPVGLFDKIRNLFPPKP